MGRACDDRVEGRGFTGQVAAIRRKASPQRRSRTLARVMHTLGPSFMDPTYLLDQFGGAFFGIALLIVFIECGVLFPILPGDSLLFAIGLFSSSSKYNFHVPL